MRRWDAHLLRQHGGIFLYALTICCGLGLLVDLGMSWKELDWSLPGLLRHIGTQSLPFLLLVTPFVFFLGLHLLFRRLHDNRELALCQLHAKSTFGIAGAPMAITLLFVAGWFMAHEFLWVGQTKDFGTTIKSPTAPLLIQKDGQQILLWLDPSRPDEAGPVIGLVDSGPVRLDDLRWRNGRWHLDKNNDAVGLLDLIPPPAQLMGVQGRLQDMSLADLFAAGHSLPGAAGQWLRRCILPLYYMALCLVHICLAGKGQRENLNRISASSLAALLFGVLCCYAF